MIPLGSARPAIDRNEPLRRRTRHILRRELELVAHAAARAGADHVLHLYADAVLPLLAITRSRGLRITTLLFYPRAHYSASFDLDLPLAERARAAAKEAAVTGWRRRRDAHAVMTLDEEAARRWRAKRGAPAYWLPEPTVESAPVPVPVSARSGCVVYGALADRKGIDLLARAIGSDRTPIRVTVAGEADPAFLPRLRELLAEMTRGGASVELRAHRHTETEGLRALATARCAALPYPRHDGMSRVLVEACSVGTPVLVHDYGLLAHLVRRHGLGLAVDCNDSRSLREALMALTTDPGATERYAPALSSFAARFSRERFAEAVSRPFRGEADATDEQHPRATAGIHTAQA
jgi:glycosyltransferase involved in cell wall biosynthesis